MVSELNTEKTKPRFKDIQEKPETTTLSVHIEYKYLKFSDIYWIYGILRKAAKEVIYQDDEIRKEIEKPEDVRVLIHSASTCKSIELELIFVAAQSLKAEDWDTIEAITSLGLLVTKLFHYLLRESRDGRYLNKRVNIDRVRIAKKRRLFAPDGTLLQEDEEVVDRERTIEEQFELNIRGRRGSW